MAFAFSESSTVTPDEMTIAHGQGDHEYSVKVIEFRGAINDGDVRKALENLPDGTKKLFSFRRPCCLILSGTHGAVEKDPQTNEPICSTVVDTVIQDRGQDAPRFAQEDKRIAFEKNLPSTFPYNVKVLDLGDPRAESVPEALNRWKPTLVVKAYCHSARQTFNKEIADYVKNEADALKHPSSSNREENIEPRSSQENQGFRSWLAQRMEASVPNLSENQEAPVPNLSENQEAPVPNLSENQEAPVPNLSENQEAPVPNLFENQEAPVPNLSENQEAPVPNLSENQEAPVPNLSGNQEVNNENLREDVCRMSIGE